MPNPELKIETPEGLTFRELSNGGLYLRLEHRADPSKDAAWLEDQRRLFSGTPGQFKREILMDDDVHEGEPVYERFDESRNLYRKSIVPHPSSTLFGGWDCGTSVSIAFVLVEVTAGGQIRCLLEVCESPSSMESFVPRVIQAVRNRVGGRPVFHVGDPTGANRQGGSGRSAFDVAREKGVDIRKSSNAWDGRLAAVEWACDDMISPDVPRFVISAPDCPMLVDGFQGAYSWACSIDRNGNQIYRMPNKNKYSHVQDALQYVLQRVRELIRKGKIGTVLCQ